MHRKLKVSHVPSILFFLVSFSFFGHAKVADGSKHSGSLALYSLSSLNVFSKD